MVVTTAVMHGGSCSPCPVIQGGAPVEYEAHISYEHNKLAADYPLHTLGWKAFQDLCLAVAQECLQRPIQRFLPSHDGGRDGAFIGTWEDDSEVVSSTIQCKFTSIPNNNLTRSLIAGELEKVPKLAARGLAHDYILITNHSVSGVAESEIVSAFESAGAKRCRVLGGDWLISQIQESARLRMLVPRLYGLGDLGNILDERAYEQAKMILSSLGDDLKKLVVTDAHRRSVEAISRHGFVLLLGAPATGKSTIGASLAVGAADLWGCLTLKPTSAIGLQERINPSEKQFFWIDDAWGATQYQRTNIDAWNQVLPHIAAAIQNGSKFLITSRSYIWEAAKKDLKMQAFPLLSHSNVTIEVEHLTADERAQILYNHLKLGDQTHQFRAGVKWFLPMVVEREDFLPESARRLGSQLLSKGVSISEQGIRDFFARPADFLFETVRNLAPAHKAALALLFVNLGRISSPVSETPELLLVENAFGVTTPEVRSSLSEMNESMVLLAHDEKGRYWRYKHPTILEAIAKLIALDPELVELYLRGAKAGSLISEVVCPGVELAGALVIVPPLLYDFLIEKISKLSLHQLRSFVSQRANAEFASRLVVSRPDLISTEIYFYSPISEDPDSDFMIKMHQFGLLPSEMSRDFGVVIREKAIEEADPSLFTSLELREFIDPEEFESIKDEIRDRVLNEIQSHVNRVRDEWDASNDPGSHFDELESAIITIVEEICPERKEEIVGEMQSCIFWAVQEMEDEYQSPNEEDAPISTEAPSDSEFGLIFSDIDE
ncbi:hypothetical protein FAZ69_17250 [Trinickia terrae]|uniref:Novel STAND NTPase 3 domain-containing protein n=1 Tax=Trinickia terrae TaxID=2571161 RepID=A0A4U1I410_9BURK|nr:hypothetical protein [Trinickia terrae]TKC88001.1 hypothetical protein FAZ69_17250 [Trinickia terrae]